MIGLLPSWLVHPLSGGGSSFYGGIGGDSTIAAAVVAGLATFWRRHNCHVHRCWRLSWHPREDGHPVCRVHHPDHPAVPGAAARLLGRFRQRLA